MFSDGELRICIYILLSSKISLKRKKTQSMWIDSATEKKKEERGKEKWLPGSVVQLVIDPMSRNQAKAKDTKSWTTPQKTLQT